MKDIVSFFAYSVFGACCASILVATGVGMGGEAKMFAAVAKAPAEWLGWIMALGAGAGFALRIILDK